MSITSVGYPGSVFEADWARISSQQGADYGVLDGFSVEALSASSVTVRAGRAHGAGISDYMALDDTVTGLDAASTWYTICLERDWSANDNAGETTLVALAGGSSRAISPERVALPGTKDHQPIALVHRSASTITDIIDLRCWWGNGGMEAASVDALAYLSRRASLVKVGADEYRHDGTSWQKVTVSLSSQTTGVLPLLAGGTGANTQADARANLDVYSKAQSAALGTTNATPDTIVRRGSGGRTNVGDPTSAGHAATKKYVDDVVGGRAEKWPNRGTRSVTLRRPDTGNFAAGSFTTLISGSWAAPAGLWLIIWMPKVTCTVKTIAHLRGRVGDNVVTNDESWTVSPDIWPMSIATAVVHPGGTLSLSLAVQVSEGTGGAGPGSRITAVWVGP